MTMAAEIKNRVGPPAAAQPTAGQYFVSIFRNIDSPSQPNNPPFL